MYSVLRMDQATLGSDLGGRSASRRIRATSAKMRWWPLPFDVLPRVTAGPLRGVAGFSSALCGLFRPAEPFASPEAPRAPFGAGGRGPPVTGRGFDASGSVKPRRRGRGGVFYYP